MVFSTPKEAVKMVVAYVLLECLYNFLLDPCYEPLLWFMIPEYRAV